MYRERGSDEGTDIPPARSEDRRSRMPVYLAASLILVIAIEMLGHHFLA